MSREYIKAVMEKVPDLTNFGIGIYGRGKGMSSTEYKKKFLEERKNLLDNVEMFVMVCNWLMSKQKIKTINQKHSSYGLKHIAQQQIGEYVTNGVFIAATVHCGFIYKRIPDSPNVKIGIGERSLKSVELL
ncbi:hypothetical protein SAMN05216404_103303 [Nitrosospira multiformis]|uniref:Uncharacterized protein n=1 Tax=Nitrosospira multiformis TaxID=1231 RepID=A0A1H8FFW7_9PROT|nr:hypothetical protein [Nitrosospira multiformis]SEN29958.1 hypothetical protein SAMN05216404_103303 [Nitrosospira multiformis]